MCKPDFETTNSVASDGKTNATGCPDTPMEVIVARLNAAMACDSLESTKELVQQALDVAAGLDPYLDQMTTPPSKVCAELIEASANHDYEEAYKQKKTIFKLKKEMS